MQPNRKIKMDPVGLIVTDHTAAFSSCEDVLISAIDVQTFDELTELPSYEFNHRRTRILFHFRLIFQVPTQ